MLKYKKFLAVIVLVLAGILVGCDNSGGEPADEDTPAEVEDSGEATDGEATEEADG